MTLLVPEETVERQRRSLYEPPGAKRPGASLREKPSQLPYVRPRY